MDHAHHPVDATGTRPGGTYEAPSLLPAAGQERTYALLIAGLPLLLILLVGVLPSLTSGDPESSGAAGGQDRGWYAQPTSPYEADEADGSEADPLPSEDPETGGADGPDLWAATPTDGEGTADPATSPTGVEEPTGSATTADPESTVEKFYDAVNARDFETAWDLGGKNLGDGDYATFVSGYDRTRRSDVVVESVDGDTVSVSLSAELTDGTQQSFEGEYTVVDGVITGGSMSPTG
ncbi:hypothetical protein ACFY30_14350 [Streptomyces sp. NPDC000345]|uniref:hypothetical protein n=1 Tax=Streptomyces sp. NPDC000345 TaxID=3364537 RepID=UPI0036812FCB